jgi:hypothetical protein
LRKAGLEAHGPECLAEPLHDVLGSHHV